MFCLNNFSDRFSGDSLLDVNAIIDLTGGLLLIIIFHFWEDVPQVKQLPVYP